MEKQSLCMSPAGEQSPSEVPGEPTEGPEGGARAPPAGLRQGQMTHHVVSSSTII